MANFRNLNKNVINGDLRYFESELKLSYGLLNEAVEEMVNLKESMVMLKELEKKQILEERELGIDGISEVTHQEIRATRFNINKLHEYINDIKEYINDLIKAISSLTE